MEEKKNRINIWEVLLLAIFLGIGISFVFSVYYNDKLEGQLRERDALIDRLMKKDSLLNKVFELEYDSTGSYSYTTIVRDGRILKYNEIYNSLDSITNKYYELENKNNRTQTELINDYNKLIQELQKNIDDYNVLVQKTNSQQKEIVSLKNKLNNKSDSIWIFKTISDMSRSQYGIMYHIKKENKQLKVSIEADRVDSALTLFPHYRHKIKKIERKGNMIESTIILDEKIYSSQEK